MCMPSRKQRRRREKTFRHEYGFVTYDEEGNEVEVEPAEIRSEKAKTEREKPKPTGKSGRPLREPPAPSWRRSLRRGGIWGGLMFVVLVFFLPGTGSPASRVLIGLLYAAAFVPLTYWIDRLAYRNYLRRSGKT
jgi:hypothetical protein